MPGESMGWAARMCVDAALPIDGSSIALEFLDEDIVEEEAIIQSEGARGTRSRSAARLNTDVRRVGGPVRMNPSPSELNTLLPYILGAQASGTTFAVADTLPDLWLAADKVAQIYTFNQGKVASAEFSGSTGQKVLLLLNTLFRSMTPDSPASWPSISVDEDEAYVFHQGVLTLGGTAYNFNSFRLTVDNAVTAEFNNSINATDLSPGDRVVTFEIPELPFTATELGLLTASRGASAGISGSLAFTSGNKSLTFTLNELRTTTRTPSIRGRSQRIKLARMFQAYKSGSTREIVVTNDSTA